MHAWELRRLPGDQLKGIASQHLGLCLRLEPRARLGRTAHGMTR